MTLEIHNRPVRFARGKVANVRLVERDVIGSEVQVARTLVALHRQGRLLNQPTMHYIGRGRVLANVRMLERVEITRKRWPRWATWAAIALVPVAVFVCGVLYLTMWLMAHLILVALMLLAVLLCWGALGRAGICPGLHCPGCAHR